MALLCFCSTVVHSGGQSTLPCFVKYKLLVFSTFTSLLGQSHNASSWQRSLSGSCSILPVALRAVFTITRPLSLRSLCLWRLHRGRLCICSSLRWRCSLFLGAGWLVEWVGDVFPQLINLQITASNDFTSWSGVVPSTYLILMCQCSWLMCNLPPCPRTWWMHLCSLLQSSPPIRLWFVWNPNTKFQNPCIFLKLIVVKPHIHLAPRVNAFHWHYCETMHPLSPKSHCISLKITTVKPCIHSAPSPTAFHWKSPQWNDAST